MLVVCFLLYCFSFFFCIAKRLSSISILPTIYAQNSSFTVLENAWLLKLFSMPGSACVLLLESFASLLFTTELMWPVKALQTEGFSKLLACRSPLEGSYSSSNSSRNWFCSTTKLGLLTVWASVVVEIGLDFHGCWLLLCHSFKMVVHEFVFNNDHWQEHLHASAAVCQFFVMKA